MIDALDLATLRTRDGIEDAALDRREPSLEPGADPVARWPDDAPVDHQIVTAGIASRVFDDDRDLLGHVLMIEFDDVDPRVPIEEARALEEPAVVLRSSPGCYHVYGLRLRTFEQALEEARATRSCPEFVDEMDDQGRFVLRTQPKLRRSSGDVYKPAPEVIEVSLEDEDGDVSSPISRPHAIRLRQIAEDEGRSDLAPVIREFLEESDAARGATLTQSRYETMTDELRSLVDSTREVVRHG